MQTLVVIAIALGVAQGDPAAERLVRAQPCGPRFVPMRFAAEPRVRAVRPPVPRRDPGRRVPCLRLAAA